MLLLKLHETIFGAGDILNTINEQTHFNEFQLIAIWTQVQYLWFHVQVDIHSLLTFHRTKFNRFFATGIVWWLTGVGRHFNCTISTQHMLVLVLIPTFRIAEDRIAMWWFQQQNVLFSSGCGSGSWNCWFALCTWLIQLRVIVLLQTQIIAKMMLKPTQMIRIFDNPTTALSTVRWELWHFSCGTVCEPKINH